MHQPSCGPVVAYLGTTIAGLLFCVQDLLVPKGNDLWKAEATLTGDVATVVSRVLQTVLETQLGVFVFSNFIIACCATTAVATTSIFLGSLTPTEASRLTQRLLKYLLFKVALVGMVVLPNEVQLLHWLPWLAVIGELKMFVGLAKDRLAGLSVSPAAGLARHVRTLCLLLLILLVNLLGMLLLWRRQLGQLSWAISMLFGLDMSITTVDAVKAALSCGAMLMDEALATSTALELPATLAGRAVAFWEAWQATGRDTFFYRTELLADVTVHVLTLLHHLHVWVLHGLSFHLLDALLLLDTRAVVLSFLQRLQAHMVHRAATHNLDHTFPDANTKQLLAQEAECVICRDKLAAAKRLPCGHLFHLQCLRAWLQQSGSDNFTCPMCRMQLYVVAAPGKGAATSAASAASTAPAAGLQAAASQHQRWRLQAAPGLMGGFLSMSLDVLPADSTARQVQHMTLHERIAAAELLEAEGLNALASPGSVAESADGFEALAEALIASVQLESSREQQQQQDLLEHGQRQQQRHEQQGSAGAGGASGGPAGIRAGMRIADDLVLTAEELEMINGSSDQQPVAAVSGAAVAGAQGCSSTPEQQRQRSTADTEITAASAGSSSSSSSGSGGGGGGRSRRHTAQGRMTNKSDRLAAASRRFGSSPADCDAVSDAGLSSRSAAANSNAASVAAGGGSHAGGGGGNDNGSGSSNGWACSRMLASLISRTSISYDGDESSGPPSPGAALFYPPGGAAAAGGAGASALTHAGTAAGAPSEGECIGSGDSSRRCHHATHWQHHHHHRGTGNRSATAATGPILSRSGSSSSTSSLAITAAGDSDCSGRPVAAAAAAGAGDCEGEAAGELLLQLLTSPRDPERRRQGGRWGRRRWLTQEGSEAP